MISFVLDRDEAGKHVADHARVTRIPNHDDAVRDYESDGLRPDLDWGRLGCHPGRPCG